MRNFIRSSLVALGKKAPRFPRQLPLLCQGQGRTVANVGSRSSGNAAPRPRSIVPSSRP